MVTHAYIRPSGLLTYGAGAGGTAAGILTGPAPGRKGKMANTRWQQDLVNAQVEIGRAVFLMNVHFGALGEYRKWLEEKSQSPEVILARIDAAIASLQKARDGYDWEECPDCEGKGYLENAAHEKFCCPECRSTLGRIPRR